jgi:hypothetical protein
MTDLAKLVVRLEAESLKFQKELDQAKRKLSAFDKSAGATAKQIGTVLGAAAVAAGTGLAYMAKKAIDLADDTSKAAQKIGLTTESLSQLRFAADLAGVASNSLDKSMQKLNRSMSESVITNTSKAAMAFSALGVEVENTDGSLRSSDDVFSDIAERFSKMRDGATKTALAMDIFGKSGADLIPLLNGGAAAIKSAREEADALGQTISGKAAKAAEQFNDNLSRLQKVAGGAMLQAVQQLTPLLANMSDELVREAKEANTVEGSASSLVTGFRLLISAAILVKGTFQTVGVAIAGLAAAIDQVDFARVALSAMGPLGTLISGLKGVKDGTTATGQAGAILGQTFTDITDRMEKDGKLMDKVWSDTAESIDVASSSITGGGADVANALKGMGAAAKQAAQEQASAMQTIAGMVQQLQQQTATYEQGEGAVLRYRIAQGDLAATFMTAGAGAEQYKAQLIGLTDQLEQMRATTEATAKHQSIFDDAMERGKQVTESTRTPIEAYESTIADLNSLLSVGAINQETYNRAIEQAGGAYDEAIIKGDEWAQATKNAADNALKSIQSSLADFLFDPFSDGLDGMLNGFVTMLRRMGAELLAAEFMKTLGGLGGGGGGGTSGTVGIIGSIAGMFGARANGGPVTGGQPYLVGERGPELVVPGSSGNVMNARETAGMGGTSVNMYISTPDADSFRASRRQVGNAVKRGIGG